MAGRKLIVSAPPPAAEAMAVVMVNTLAVAGPTMRRVMRLTLFTLAMENLSPMLTLSPAVKVTTSEMPLWLAPLTVTAPAQVPAVCAQREFDSSRRNPASGPRRISLNSREISAWGLNTVVMFCPSDCTMEDDRQRTFSLGDEGASLS